jgi:hypothetical protein
LCGGIGLSACLCVVWERCVSLCGGICLCVCRTDGGLIARPYALLLCACDQLLDKIGLPFLLAGKLQREEVRRQPLLLIRPQKLLTDHPSYCSHNY